MAFIRPGHNLRWIKGESEDYIYETETPEGKLLIIDYGGIEDSGLAELLCESISERYGKNTPFGKYLRKKVAERLGVSLRSRPLSDKQMLKKIFAKYSIRKKKSDFKRSREGK